METLGHTVGYQLNPPFCKTTLFKFTSFNIPNLKIITEDEEMMQAAGRLKGYSIKNLLYSESF